MDALVSGVRCEDRGISYGSLHLVQCTTPEPGMALHYTGGTTLHYTSLHHTALKCTALHNVETPDPYQMLGQIGGRSRCGDPVTNELAKRPPGVGRCLLL